MLSSGGAPPPLPPVVVARVLTLGGWDEASDAAGAGLDTVGEPGVWFSLVAGSPAFGFASSTMTHLLQKLSSHLYEAAIVLISASSLDGLAAGVSSSPSVTWPFRD